MKQSIVCLLFLIICFELHSRLLSEDPKEVAFPEFASELYAGEMRPGESREVNVKLKNALKVPIRLLGSSSSCGCTSPSFERAEISAEEEIRLTLKLSPGTRIGRVESQVGILFESQSDEKSIYKAIGSVVYDVRPVCRFPGAKIRCVVSPGRAKSLRIPVENFGNWDWHECRVSISLDGFAGEVVVLPEEKKLESGSSPRQRFLVTIPFSEEQVAKIPDHGEVAKLTFYAKSASGSIVEQKLGELAIEIACQRNFMAKPKSIELNKELGGSIFLNVLQTGSHHQPLNKSSIAVRLFGSEVVITNKRKEISNRWIELELDKNELIAGLKNKSTNGSRLLQIDVEFEDAIVGGVVLPVVDFESKD